MTDEIRVTDPDTGGQKGQKLERFDLIPWDAITELARHFGRGARKYQDRNWERGYRWSLSYSALIRHLTQWWQGEDLDEETGTNHLIAVAWHALVLWWFQKHHKGTDDRPWFEETVDPKADLDAVSGISPLSRGPAPTLVSSPLAHCVIQPNGAVWCDGFDNQGTAHWHKPLGGL